MIFWTKVKTYQEALDEMPTAMSRVGNAENYEDDELIIRSLNPDICICILSICEHNDMFTDVQVRAMKALLAMKEAEANEESVLKIFAGVEGLREFEEFYMLCFEYFNQALEVALEAAE